MPLPLPDRFRRSDRARFLFACWVVKAHLRGSEPAWAWPRRPATCVDVDGN
jgi:hypothetical protein